MRKRILFIISIFLLTGLYLYINNPFPPSESSHTNDWIGEKREASPTIESTKHSIDKVVFTPKTLSLFFRRTSKFFKQDTHSLCLNCQLKVGIPTTPKIVFAAYRFFLSTTIPDPRIYILSSRAHPPTFSLN